MTPAFWKQATTELSTRDAILGRLISTLGPAKLRSRGEPFVTLARSIVGQQISIKAADSIWTRFSDNVESIVPTVIMELEEQTLRSCGLSGRKVTYLKELARHFILGSINPKLFRELDDEVIISELTKVKGIGRWTAEMFLIFHLLRPNVLPLGDVGLQRALALHYGNGKIPSLRKIKRITTSWIPWRSVATWYLWRSLDPVAVEY